MRWRGTHLTYCLNVHPGESWDENFEAIRTHAAAVKARVAPEAEFGLGLRLSARAASELEGRVDEFRAFLEGAGMYVFTVNGFPHGRFHGTRVKENVYRPDWSTPERLDYTLRLARLLAELLPPDVDGSISTVPVAYGKDIAGDALANLVEAARGLARLHDQTGARVLLALEPEPDCALETTDEAIAFFERLCERGGDAVSGFLGICLDACHMACEFEEPATSLRRLEAAGVRVPKVHVSSALIVPEGEDAPALLAPFADPVYFHQTAVRSGEVISRFPDLPQAIEAAPEGEWRVHFHVPLHFSAESGLRSSSHLLGEEFIAAAVKPGRHVEIETYTFDVLPGPRGDVVDSIVSEFTWLLGGS